MQDLGRLFDAQSSEITELDNARFACVHAGEPVQRLVERHEHAGFGGRESDGLVPWNAICMAAALLPLYAARMIDEDLPHDAGCDAEEVRPILPLYIRLID